ncbi:MAG: PorP/SprF family type IX secretion system membrane protein [Bacteroidota bacterium]
MKYLYLLLIGACFCMNSAYLHAQDPIFMQYYANKLYLNPAFAGYEPGLSFNGNFREQWIPVEGQNAKFQTTSAALSLEVAKLQSGFGLLYLDHTEGAGMLRLQSAGILYAFRSRTCGQQFEDEWEFSFGLRATYNWRQLNWENLVFSDQLDAIYGIVRPTSAPVPDDLLSQNNYYDLDAGILVDRYFNKGTNSERILRLGFSLSHIVRAEGNVAEIDDTLGVRLNLHATLELTSFNENTGKPYNVAGLFRMELQPSTTESNAAWYRQVNMGVAVYSRQNSDSRKSPSVYGGLFLNNSLFFNRDTEADVRNMNAVTLLAGYEFPIAANDNLLSFGISYSYDYSGLRSNSGGIWEVSTNLNLPGGGLMPCKRKSGKNGPPCPRF